MKKLLAILLAMMLVMVSAVALATEAEPETIPENETPLTDNQETENEEDNNDQPGSTPGSSELSDYVDAAQVSVTTGYNSDTGHGGLATTEPQTITIPKKINMNTADEADAHPEVSLEFEVTTSSVALSTVDTAPAITINNNEPLTIASSANEAQLRIQLPAYTAVGEYTYVISETTTDNINIAGMVNTSDLTLKVTVIQDPDGLKIAGVALRTGNTKVSEIDNLYNAGALTVTKTVDGNMGDRTKPFPVVITLNAPTGTTVASSTTYSVAGGTASDVTWTGTTATINVNLTHGQTVTVNNIPAGVTYTVVEGEAISHVENAQSEPANANAYYVEGEVTAENTEATNRTISGGATASATITNTKNINVDTGVSMDSVPYMVLMAIALIGGAVLFLRKREEY